MSSVRKSFQPTCTFVIIRSSVRRGPETPGRRSHRGREGPHIPVPVFFSVHAIVAMYNPHSSLHRSIAHGACATNIQYCTVLVSSHRLKHIGSAGRSIGVLHTSLLMDWSWIIPFVVASWTQARRSFLTAGKQLFAVAKHCS